MQGKQLFLQVKKENNNVTLAVSIILQSNKIAFFSLFSASASSRWERGASILPWLRMKCSET